MLDINPETVCRLIELAREFHAQEEVVIPEVSGNPSGDWAMQMLASHSDDLTFQEFKYIVGELEPSQQQLVVVLLWLGRGDYTLDDWDDLLEQACVDWTPNTAEYLIAHPLMVEYLTEGLDIFGYSCD
jgi:Protein of unknown function (DUF3775)